MSASMLYHTNQITDVQEKKVDYFSEKIVYHVRYSPKMNYARFVNTKNTLRRAQKSDPCGWLPWEIKPHFFR